LGFLDSLRGLFKKKKTSRPSGVRRGPLPQRRADVPTQQIARPPGAFGHTSPPPQGPAIPYHSPATELRPQPLVDRPEPQLPPSTGGSSMPAWDRPTPPRPAREGREGRAASTGSGETKYHTALSLSGGKTMGVLIAVEGELEGDVFRVPDGENLIGRDKQCSIVVPSEWISRTHAKLVHRDGLFVVAPMSDKNPTFVNDERTEGTELKDGDFLKLGKTTFRFRTVA